MKSVKIFGERNTSTNALYKVIEQNSKSRVAPSTIDEVSPNLYSLIRYGSRIKMPHQVREMIIDYAFPKTTAIDSWKHTTTNFKNVDDLQDVHVIFCVRHPASWILGLYRKPYHIYEKNYNDLYSFLATRWKTVGRERLHNATTSATEIYNLKLESYSTLKNMLSENKISYSVVRHEDFAVNQLEVFQKIAPYLDQPTEKFHPLEVSTKDKSKDSEYYKEYYGEKLWVKDIDKKSLDKINNEIDWHQLSSYEYYPI